MLIGVFVSASTTNRALRISWETPFEGWTNTIALAATVMVECFFRLSARDVTNLVGDLMDVIDERNAASAR